MLTILTKTNNETIIKSIIHSIDRLNELVEIVTNENLAQSSNKILVISDNLISASLDWNDTEPPYLFPELSFSKENLLGIIFYKLGNHQKAFEFISEENPVYNHLLIATHLQFGYDITEDMCAFVELGSLHNRCIIEQYGTIKLRRDVIALKTLYAEAIANAPNDELRLFTIKHFVNFLLDTNAYAEAEKVLRLAIPRAISSESKNAINTQLASVLMAQLKVPYNLDSLAEIQELQQLRKATLLYIWSKNGSPQYYKPAINAFQDTLKVFKRDTHPQKFAEIHHSLALIYSEIPVSSEEKPIWTAFCASSFKEVLGFFTKEQYPYEYAMASHNYATALMNFPEAKLHNNLDKAFGLFEDALTVRTINEYPFERALTLGIILVNA